MNILIVDDNDMKAGVIRTFLHGELALSGETADIRHTTHLSEAVRLVTSVSFELIVLDLMLPYLSDGQPDALAGFEMLTQIRHKGGPNSGAAVIGLSAYPEEVRDFREKFDRANVLIMQYDEAGAWQSALRNALFAVVSRRTAKHHVDFLIVTALEEERAGFSGTELEQVGELVIAGLNVREVTIPGAARPHRGALIKLRQMGLAAAILDASIALSAFKTRVICMSGICAGFAGRAALGQLIVASPAWEYQAGKWSGNGFQIAPTQIPLPSPTRVVLDQVMGLSSFHQAIENGLDRRVIRPSRWSEPILAPAASGSAVIADGARLNQVEQQHRKIAALDMETFGIYYAAHEVTAGPEHFFSIKSVVDLAEASKGDDLHRYGCAASARATLFILRHLLEKV